jgi:hypothetical protein
MIRRLINKQIYEYNFPESIPQKGDFYLFSHATDLPVALLIAGL